VHALTDVTGFGLLGHTLELSRASGLAAHIRLVDLPWLPGVQEMARQGVVTGASGRNWVSYGAGIELASSVGEADKALLTDPQTSGGLLVSCSASAVESVLDIFRSQGFAQAAVIGEMRAGDGRVHVA